MTQRKIAYALSQIKVCKENGFFLEAFIKSYHLNIELMKFILSKSKPKYEFSGKKIKIILNDFLNEISNDQNLKSIINKKNLKIVKPWLIKVDAYFKDLKLGTLINTKPLLSENEKVFGILNISITKLFIKSKK